MRGPTSKDGYIFIVIVLYVEVLAFFFLVVFKMDSDFHSVQYMDGEFISRKRGGKNHFNIFLCSFGKLLALVCWT